ncbi:MAG TPA: universal stress protein [Streptosporangiaceae bacterium]|jgi:nucleotide-binding universal stress UspA family protein
MANDKVERGLVVVGVDGSRQSIAALHWAARYAAASGAAVRAVLAWHYPTAAGQPPVGVAPAPIRHESEAAMQTVLDDAVREAFPGGGAEVETRLLYGHPSQALIEQSKEADLLVVGNSGHGAFTGMLVGSVSIHCVTGAFCPVTVVRGAVTGE